VLALLLPCRFHFQVTKQQLGMLSRSSLLLQPKRLEQQQQQQQSLQQQ
jgi:hypothetical protein